MARTFTNSRHTESVDFGRILTSLVANFLVRVGSFKAQIALHSRFLHFDGPGVHSLRGRFRHIRCESGVEVIIHTGGLDVQHEFTADLNFVSSLGVGTLG